MSAPFGNSPPTSVQISRGVDYANKTLAFNLVVDKLNEWLTQYNAPFPQIARVNPMSSSRKGSWTNELRRLTLASNQFYDWGYGGGTTPLPIYSTVGFTAFTTVLNKIIAYWAAPFSNAPVAPDQTLPPALVWSPIISTPTDMYEADVGETITCTMGIWEGEPTSYAYQYGRTTVGVWGPEEIEGANTATYIVAPAEVGYEVFCILTASNAAGSSDAYTNAIIISEADDSESKHGQS